jgi:hypothetical protein
MASICIIFYSDRGGPNSFDIDLGGYFRLYFTSRRGEYFLKKIDPTIIIVTNNSLFFT